MNKMVLIFASIFMSCIVSAQVVRTDTLYYDNMWIKTTPENALYYKVVNQDKNNNPVGVVKEYYITGELKTTGELLFLDREDDNNSKWKGKKTGFYRSGKKATELNFTQDGERNSALLKWDEQTGEVGYGFYFENDIVKDLYWNSFPSLYDDLTDIFSKTTSDTVVNNNVTVIRIVNEYEVYSSIVNGKPANYWQFNDKHDLVSAGAVCNDIDAAKKDLESNGFSLVVMEDPEISEIYQENRMVKYALKNYSFVYIFKVSSTNSNQGVLNIHSKFSTWF